MDKIFNKIRSQISAQETKPDSKHQYNEIHTSGPLKRTDGQSSWLNPWHGNDKSSYSWNI